MFHLIITILREVKGRKEKGKGTDEIYLGSEDTGNNQELCALLDETEKVILAMIWD